ncbi:DNA replication factor Cdt1 [Erpetoichthys calabaricus]|uniref:DNA replication factor Cdt1 n=1 Tax=Erpetoichthys calabaricus TaxID=27687 RepID=UPI002234BA8B|nr:DNA replication factor Cdt1 [Erpetoichthys calabaricus]
MAQAKVTDFFARSKKAGSGILQTKRVKGTEDILTGNETLLKSPENKLPSTRSRTRVTDVGLETSQPKPYLTRQRIKPQNHPPLQVESRPQLSNKDVERAGNVTETGELKPPTTPKRNAECDVVIAARGHSSAKKRLKTDKELETHRQPGANGDKKSARKRLLLEENGEDKEQMYTAAPGVAEMALAPSSVEKKVKDLVNKNSSLSPGPKGDDVQGSQENQSFSKHDMKTLKAKIQSIREKGDQVSRAAISLPPSSSEFQTRLKRVRELEAKVQERKKIDVAETQPQTEESQPVPAYQRYHTLAEDVAPGLTLPYKYKLLAEMFRSMDTIVAMLYNRSETATFAKVKQGIQDMMRKKFEEHNVGQIKTVYPTAYTFRQEKNIPSFSTSVKKTCYQLTIEPLLQTENTGRPHLSASRLLERRQTFSRYLVNIMKQHHKAFLSSLNPPIKVPDDRLTRWHPRFNVDEVPDIAASDLPRPPQVDKLTTAQEVLDKARSLMTPKMEKALANIALRTAESHSEEPKETSVTNVLPVAASPTTPSALKGVSQSLLERIRAKEAQKMQAMMTRNPEQEERLTMMSRLVELVRILRNVFVAEKKPALSMEVACSRVVSSYRSTMTQGEMEKHLKLASVLLPDWLTVHPIRKDLYLKINKSLDLNVVLEKLNQKIKEEERV